MFLDHLYSAYHAAMQSRAMRYMDTQSDAEDVVSDCWVSFMQHFPELCSMKDSTRSAYIMISVRNRAIDYLRKRSRSRECTSFDGIIPSAERIADRNDVEIASLKHEAQREMLTILSPRERQVARLWLCGYNALEIAVKLRITPAAVRGHEWKIRNKWKCRGIWNF